MRARLDQPWAWAGIVVREPARGVAYRRAVCRDELATGTERYRVAVHVFDEHGYEGELHDHRWPIAVLPLDLAGEVGVPLYEMPWQVRGGPHNLLVVRSGEPWAIEHCRDVLHAVRSRTPHASIVIADLGEPATRDNRMQTEPMDEAAVAELLMKVRYAARAHPEFAPVTDVARR